MEYEDEDTKNLQTRPIPGHELAAVWAFIVIGYFDSVLSGIINCYNTKLCDKYRTLERGGSLVFKR